MAIIALIFAPYPYNIGIAGLYLLLLFLRMFIIKPRAYGYLHEKKTGLPLSFAVLRVFSAELEREIFQRVADQLGKYYILVPKEKYYLKIERRNDDGSYSLIYTSPVIDAKQGVINMKLKI